MTRTYRMRPPVPAKPDERSYWIQSVRDRDEPRLPPLSGSARARIAIIGGGMTGLWTAWRLLELDPEADIAILEADFCGSGASGRNGGQVHTWFGNLDFLRAVAGRDEALRLARATDEAIRELDELQNSGRIDMDLRLAGFTSVSIAPVHDGGWRGVIEQLDELGEHPYEWIEGTSARNATGAATSREGVLEPHSGTMNPYKLVAGMRDDLISRGVQVYEGTPVTELVTGGSTVELRTPEGRLIADRVLVASNAWAGSIPQINSAMYAVDGQVVTTEPIPEILDEIGLVPGRAVSDSQMQVLYLQRTVDDRLLLGQGSGLPIFRDRLGRRTNRNPRLEAEVTAELHRMYPATRDARIEYAWVGPIDISATHLPIIDTLRDAPNVLFCVGWTGTALAQIPVVARMLASKLVDRDDEWSRSPLANQSGRITRVFPEPFRYVGARLVRRAVIRRVVRERSNKRVGWITRALIALMPRYRGPGDEYVPRQQ